MTPAPVIFGEEDLAHLCGCTGGRNGQWERGARSDYLLENLMRATAQPANQGAKYHYTVPQQCHQPYIGLVRTATREPRLSLQDAEMRRLLQCNELTLARTGMGGGPCCRRRQQDASAGNRLLYRSETRREVITQCYLLSS